MTINEQIVTGRKFRKLIDEASRLWLRISFWTKASDVEFDDGEDAETKVSTIQAIIENIKESFNAFKKVVQDSLNSIQDKLGGCSIEQEGEDFYIVGADAVRKKLGSGEIELLKLWNSTSTNETAYVAPEDMMVVGCCVSYTKGLNGEKNKVQDSSCSVAIYDNTARAYIASSTSTSTGGAAGSITFSPGIYFLPKGNSVKMIISSGGESDYARGYLYGIK